MIETNHSKTAPLGTIEIAPEVIESIAGIAAAHVKGFYPAEGIFVSSMNSLLRKDKLAVGVTLTESEGLYNVDVYGAVDYGVSVPKIALALQEKIKEQLLFSCELEINQVNIHIRAIIPAKVESQELFELEDEE